MTTDKNRGYALTDEHIAQLKQTALAATPQNIDSAQSIDHYNDGRLIECPCCSGEGNIELEADFLNYDGKALGVQFYGIGNEPGAAEAYFRAANPANILALLARLESAESALTASPVEQPAASPIPKLHCQNCGDVCLAGNRDGVCCPDDSCDIDDGVRKDPRMAQPAPSPADERAAFSEVGFITQDDIHGWHFAPTVGWEFLGKGRALYARAPSANETGAVLDALKRLHVGDSQFEGWFASEDRDGVNPKQLARDAYAAGMEDLLVMTVLDVVRSPAMAADAVAIRNAALDEAAAVVADHQRKGREWIPTSLWGNLANEAANRIRALKSSVPRPAHADAREGLMDKHRRAISSDIAALERNGWTDPAAVLRALLVAHPGQPAPRYSITDDQRDKIECAEECLRNTGRKEDREAANGLLDVLIAHPVMPEPRAEVTDDDKLCASRYRWLSRQVVATHSRDDLNCRWEVDYVLYGESFDTAIDAARTGASS